MCSCYSRARISAKNLGPSGCNAISWLPCCSTPVAYPGYEPFVLSFRVLQYPIVNIACCVQRNPKWRGKKPQAPNLPPRTDHVGRSRSSHFNRGALTGEGEGAGSYAVHISCHFLRPAALLQPWRRDLLIFPLNVSDGLQHRPRGR